MKVLNINRYLKANNYTQALHLVLGVNFKGLQQKPTNLNKV